MNTEKGCKKMNKFINTSIIVRKSVVAQAGSTVGLTCGVVVAATSIIFAAFNIL